MKRILLDPLTHFLLIGAALFMVFELVNPAPQTQENTILISSGDIEALRATFARTWQRQPTDEELGRIIQEKIRDEIAYREAIAMGIDKNDVIIQKRLRMKIELLLEDMAGITTPSDQELQAFLNENRTKYQQDPKIAFKQVFINNDRSKPETEELLGRIIGELRQAGSKAEPALFSDVIMLPAQVPLSSAANISRQFGKDFTTALLKSELGTWVGPVRSGYGFHLVFVEEVVPGRDPELAEIRQVVERDWSVKKREALIEQAYLKLQERYPVVIEEQAKTDA